MTLREYYNAHKNNFPDDLRLRLHRAISWIEKAQDSGDDLDIKFISLWIAFNAAYARDLTSAMVSGTDKADFKEFLTYISSLDIENVLYNLIWQKFSQNIRVLLDNRYAFQSFWKSHNGTCAPDAWIEDFDKANKKARNALAAQDAHAVLIVIFDRLYTLRNQIVHGGATYHSSANRAQLKDGCEILGEIVPAVVAIIMQNPNKDWGKPHYPLVKD